jgi:hypothetical protein
MTQTIELQKAENTRRYDEKKRTYVGEAFDRGERIIVVDGARWGRTIVTYHGVHGTTHTFVQHHGGEIEGASVKSEKRRWNKEGWRPTEDRVLEKVRELVSGGQLRHPDVVKAENEQAAERYRKQREKAEVEHAANFRKRALKACGANVNPDDPLVDRVVEAMKWAQTQ